MYQSLEKPEKIEKSKNIQSAVTQNTNQRLHFVDNRQVSVIQRNIQDNLNKSLIVSSNKNVIQLKGVTLSILKDAIGGGFRTTGGGETSDDELLNHESGRVKCHITIDSENSSNLHVSFYPSVDEEYQNKIIQYGYTWNSATETFGVPSQTLSNWKNYKSDFNFFKKNATSKIETLTMKIKGILNKPPTAPLLGFISGGFMVRREDDMGYKDELEKK